MVIPYFVFLFMPKVIDLSLRNKTQWKGHCKVKKKFKICDLFGCTGTLHSR